ncbi:major facilitator superfamily transporter [Cladorrhinum samala]|uniref:Major facilitator superfamily transporter n=1 Tax=Cladorrhinum samala TaxID=585594 RepID=A0AAV9I016_9PEZI|nr:major facilitator superfamily transporter [Cladorrhinum samala]
MDEKAHHNLNSDSRTVVNPSPTPSLPSSSNNLPRNHEPALFETNVPSDYTSPPSHGGSDPKPSTNTAQRGAQSVPDDYPYPEGWKLHCILMPVLLAYFLVYLDLAIVSTATPAITARFNSLTDVGWYGGAYQLGSSAFQPISGKIYNYFSTKWAFLAFFCVFEVGSLLCAVSRSSAMFIVGRAVAGVGTSGLANGALTIIASVLPPRKQASFMGINIGLGQMGLALGPILGGVFTEYVNWRWCFYINLPVGAPVALLLLLMKVPEPVVKPPVREVLATAAKSLDLPGFMLVAPGAVMLLLGLQFGGNEHPWDSSVVIGLLCGGGATLLLFLAWEHRQGDRAMMPFAMLRNRVIRSAAVAMFFCLGALVIADFYLAIYFQAVKDSSPLVSGVHMLPTTIGMVLFTMVSGVMIERFGYYLPWILGGSSVAAAGYGLLSLLDKNTPAARWIGYQVLYGVGSGAMSSSAYIALQNLVPAAQIPIAMSILIFLQNMGGAVFLVAANTIFSNTLRSALNDRASTIGIPADVIIASGAFNVRDLVQGSTERLDAILDSYTDAIANVMYLGIGTSVGTFIFGWGLGWKDIRVARKLNAIRDSLEEDKPEVEKRKDGRV